MTNATFETYPAILRRRMDAGEITYALAYRWLLSHGMKARHAARLLTQQLEPHPDAPTTREQYEERLKIYINNLWSD